MIDKQYAIKTYRYLRLAMVGLVGFLFTAVLVEWWHTGRSCLQTTLSAYYYTPAQAVFVSSLVAIGVLMVVVKGNTQIEDILLNLAGMLASIVAFVPTPGQGDCWSTPVNTGNTAANVANNVGALLVVAVLALIVMLVVAARTGRPEGARLGRPLSVLLVVGFGIWFLVDRTSFVTGAHYVAAIALFLLIGAVVLINAVRYRRQDDGGALVGNPYSLIAALMAVAAVAFGLAAWLTNGQHAILWLEVSEIVLFAAFWLIQTRELWDDGLRPMPAAHRAG